MNEHFDYHVGPLNEPLGVKSFQKEQQNTTVCGQLCDDTTGFFIRKQYKKTTGLL